MATTTRQERQAARLAALAPPDETGPDYDLYEDIREQLSESNGLTVDLTTLAQGSDQRLATMAMNMVKTGKNLLKYLPKRPEEIEDDEDV